MKKMTLLAATLFALTTVHAQWALTGNAGTTPGTNFIGTTDAKDLVFKTSNAERMRLTNLGNFDFYGSNEFFGYLYGSLQNFRYKFLGSTLFNVSESAYAFSLYCDATNGTYLRVDTDHLITYLQEEDGGKVVIGSKTFANCATCTGYSLFVKNGIRTEKVKVDIPTTAGWADYVFHKDYKLMPLWELNDYISKNQHLPEVPSAQEVVDNGVELKEMTTLLLKKFEELTLYTIEQQKQIDELKRQVSIQNTK